MQCVTTFAEPTTPQTPYSFAENFARNNVAHFTWLPVTSTPDRGSLKKSSPEYIEIEGAKLLAWFDGPRGPWPLHYPGFTITLIHTFGGTSPDE